MVTKEKIFDDPFKDGLYQLVVWYAAHNDPVSLILKFQSIRSVVEAFYQVMVNHKEMEPINNLEEKEKNRIWKLTEGLDKRERIKASRAIYLIEKIK